MSGPSTLSLFIIAGLLSAGVAQYSGWDLTNGQNSSTMCTWRALRAAVIRDTVYMDGGDLYWTPGYSDGSFQYPVEETKTIFGTYSFALNFSIPFDVSQNISALFSNISKGPAANPYYDGAMLANNDEWFLYGGMTTQTETNVEETPIEVWEYQAYDYGIDESFSAGFKTYEIDRLGNLSTRYIAYGGAASVPSENLGFYFSGLRSPSGGDIWYPDAADLSLTAVNVSNTLISVDFSTQNEETWTNYTLPDNISGRANPELVWIPVGKQGILVAIGGVVDPEFVTAAHVSVDAATSVSQSPAFMTTIDVYDIANGTWYTQSTTGKGPGQLTQGCAVMQPAPDYSSFNIYWYGGYDGLNLTVDSAWNDAVWVLSLPSFIWKQVSEARTDKARAGHKCFMPYPDQMLVIGGDRAQSGGNTYNCLSEIVQLFNVSSATWLDNYDPAVWSNYSVPSMVYDVIGGSGSGGATVTKPSSWDNAALGDVFQVAYATSKITTYYPYPAATTTAPGTSATVTPVSNHNTGSSVPKFLPPLLGVLLGLILISSVVVGVVVWRNRRLVKKNGNVTTVSNEPVSRVLSWINGQQPAMAAKTETVTSTDEIMVHPRSRDPDVGLRYTQHPAFGSYYGQSHGYYPLEVPNNEIVELPATPGAAELSDVPMTPSDIVNRTLSGTQPRDASSLGWSSMRATDQGSMVSSTSFARNAPGPPPPPSSTSHGGVSSVAPSSQPAAGVGGPANNKVLPELPAGSPRGDSGVSAFSEGERAHLRSSSDPATVSTMDAVIAPPTRSSVMSGNRVASPPILEEGAVESANRAVPPGVVSPPTDGTAEGEDYLGARVLHGVVSPVEMRTEVPRPGSRRSAFKESVEDLGGEQRP